MNRDEPIEVPSDTDDEEAYTYTKRRAVLEPAIRSSGGVTNEARDSSHSSDIITTEVREGVDTIVRKEPLRVREQVCGLVLSN